jgi:hypothetical protein
MSARTRFALELPFARRRPLLALGRREQEVFGAAKTKFNRQIRKRATGYQALLDLPIVVQRGTNDTMAASRSLASCTKVRGRQKRAVNLAIVLLDVIEGFERLCD